MPLVVIMNHYFIHPLVKIYHIKSLSHFKLFNHNVI